MGRRGVEKKLFYLLENQGSINERKKRDKNKKDERRLEVRYEDEEKKDGMTENGKRKIRAKLTREREIMLLEMI